MKKIVMFLAALGFLFPMSVSAACSPVALGGTGGCTFTQGLVYSPGGTKAFGTAATTTATCSGTISCTTFTVIGSSPITLTGSNGGGGGNVSTSSAETATYVPFYTSTATSPALISGGVAAFTFNSAASRLTVTYASSTASTATNIFSTNGLITYASSTAATATNLFSTNALLTYASSTAGTATQFYATNALITYASSTAGTVATLFSTTASTTNLNVSALPGTILSTSAGGSAQATTVSSPLTFSGSTLACATCSTTSAANPTGTVGLAVVNGSASTFLRSDGAPALSQAIVPTWTALHTFVGGATTTSLSVYNYFQIPTSTSPTVTVAGQAAINTTTASSSVNYYDGTNTGHLYDETEVSFDLATSSPSLTSSSTITITSGKRSKTMTYMGCTATGGTANVQMGNGTASSTMIAATNTAASSTFTTLSTNNSFGYGTKIWFEIGTFSAATVSHVTCALGRRFTN